MDGAIKVIYKGLDGTAHEAFIQPLKRKEGVLVLHKLIAVFGALETGQIGEALKTLDGETFWDMASKLLRYSTIDLKECKDLDSFDGFNTRFGDLYALVFEALKANYPDFFGAMGLNDLTKSIGPKTEGV